MTKSLLAPYFDHLDIRNVIVLTMPMMLMLVPMVSHDQKSHVALNLDYPDHRSAMVLLTMLYAIHDVDASANGII